MTANKFVAIDFTEKAIQKIPIKDRENNMKILIEIEI
jgi:hypothetical protein